ncbi:SUMF1/EgtB/PvdO family nonheme iron enzyme, partial [candidate division KSB1 bacterium]|nr:SUMF1/EgtB/PvdO family nonheme iron enzyme [candidate division KSB1 bacterium]
MQTPVVFISSTYKDLVAHRAKARDAVMKAGLRLARMEEFEATTHPPLQTSLDKVRECDLLIVLVAYRYGWIPDDQLEPAEKKSITWLECEEMIGAGKKVLAFFVDDNYEWPKEYKDEYELLQVLGDGSAMNVFSAVNLKIQKLKEFKEWLKRHSTPRYFTTPDNLETAVLHALHMWQQPFRPDAKATKKSADFKYEIPPAYLDWLQKKYFTIEVSAHLSKQGSAAPRLSSVYVPTPTSEWRQSESADKKEAAGIREKKDFAFLLDRFAGESLYAPGIAGSGKSTFCRWIVYLLCSSGMPEQVQMSGAEKIVEKFPAALKDKLPLLIPLREFWTTTPHRSGQREMGQREFIVALQGYVENRLSGIDWRTMERFLNNGKVVLLLDGVDEIPISAGENKDTCYPREMILSGLKSCIPEWIKMDNRVLLTSRPYGVTTADEEQLGLGRADVIDLPPQLQHLFIHRWFTALAYDGVLAAAMIAHLQEREELLELTGNPVMLMAMCILYPEGGRLPQDKAELYHLTIDRILYNRYRDPIEVEKAQLRLSVVAHGMHTGEGLGEKRRSPLAETTKSEIDSMLQAYLEQQTYKEKGFTTVAEAREDLLSRSGLLIQRGDQQAAFYHLSFQDYLAARRLVQLADNLYPIIDEHADISEWRQTLAFAFGILLRENPPDKNMRILAELIKGAKKGQWKRLVLLGDFYEIVNAKGYLPADETRQRFVDFCSSAIKERAPVQERFDLVRAYGLIGDERMVEDLRQAPEGYILIPAGNLTLGETGRKASISQPFHLSKYPVTNGQFRLFVEEDGYKRDEWWSKEGRLWREKEQISEPEYWRHGRWNAPNFPVVGVSWYEAEAFCAWAGGRLPTEAEWEWAAGRGERKYPWGEKEPTEEHANYTSEPGRTTPVGIYPDGATPDGLMDMAGNVWEWCSDIYSTTSEYRVVRGGSWG